MALDVDWNIMVYADLLIGDESMQRVNTGKM